MAKLSKCGSNLVLVDGRSPNMSTDLADNTYQLPEETQRNAAVDFHFDAITLILDAIIVRND